MLLMMGRRCNSCLSGMWHPSGPGETGKSDEELREAEMSEFFFSEQAICTEECCRKVRRRGKGRRVGEVMRYLFEPCEGCVRFEEERKRVEERRVEAQMRGRRGDGLSSDGEFMTSMMDNSEIDGVGGPPMGWFHELLDENRRSDSRAL